MRRRQLNGLSPATSSTDGNGIFSFQTSLKHQFVGKSLQIYKNPSDLIPLFVRIESESVFRFRCNSQVTSPSLEKLAMHPMWDRAERVFMGLFARKMDKFGGSMKKKNKEKGFWEYDYESFVEV